MTDIKEISFHDTKTIQEVDEVTGEVSEKEVKIFIPECCREGWDSCTHVVKHKRAKKKNIGL